MKKKTIFIVASFVAALSFVNFDTPSVHAARQVLIGFVLPLTNSSANTGKQIKFGATIAADEINRKGGVASLGGAKLKLIFADSETTPSVGYSETERLITEEEVSVLCGAYNSFVTFPAATVAEKHKTPWVVNSSVMDDITERGFKYVFRPCNTAFYDAKEQFASIETFSEETGAYPRTIGHIYQATEWGHSHAQNIRKLAKEKGYILIVDKAYFPDREDFSEHLAQIRKRQPDLMFLSLYTDEHIAFSTQYLKSRIDIPFGIHSVGAGSEDPAFYSKVPRAAVEYMFVQEDWPTDRMESNSRLQMLDKKFRNKLGFGIDAYGAQGYSNVYVIYDALERSGSAEREKIRDALAKTNITSGPALITGYQKISFDKKGQNVNAHGVVSQNQKGRRITLWPIANRFPKAKPIWPVPAWDKR
jgi:branched-chain amino acid transport system substrate-binding protein